MIKIEKIEGGSPTVVREGNRTQVFINQLLTPEEYSTLQVSAGKVLVSIHEQELVWHVAETGTVEETQPEADVVETKPAIVFPSKSTKK